MKLLLKEKLFSRSWFINYTLIIIGSFIMAAGYVFFITPHRIVPGGVYGISIVIHYLTESIFKFAPDGLPVGLMGLIMNIPLTIIGIRVLGPRFGIKTILGFFLTASFIDLGMLVWGTVPLVEGDVLLSCIFGGVLIGFGLGLVFRSRATTGGSDIVAMIFAKYTRLPLGQLLIYIDSVIVLLGLAAFGDWKIPGDPGDHHTSPEQGWYPFACLRSVRGKRKTGYFHNGQPQGTGTARKPYQEDRPGCICYGS